MDDRPAVSRILILKTAALGDVLRTTSILPGIAAKYPGTRVTWVTAAAARPLVEHHPHVHAVLDVDARDADAVASLAARLQRERWLRVLSLDDELPLCRLAASVPCDQLSGAFARDDGPRAYTDDVAPWFDMGLLSRLGKTAADRMKVDNQRSHPEIYAAMLGVAMGQPELPLPASAVARATDFAAAHALHAGGPVIGLNTGAGGRWPSKGLPVEVVVGAVRGLRAALLGKVTFLLLGGPEERARNAALAAAIGALPGRPRLIDAGTDHALLDFAALVDRCDLLLTSDSLALHLAIARRRPIVAFFAPTSAAEIELYGLGEKVASTAPDYCSYRPDADNRTLTPARLVAACERVLGAAR